MQMWKDWALQLCTALIAAGILSLLFPSGGGRAGKTAVSLFILCSMILPFHQMSGGFTLDFSQAEILTERWEEQLQFGTEELAYSLAEDHILELIQTRLELLGIGVYGLEAELSTSDLTLQLLLPTKEQYREQELRNLLFQEYGITQADFIWQEDDENGGRKVENDFSSMAEKVQ